MYGSTERVREQSDCPNTVSKHCGDSAVISVMDIGGSSVSNHTKFKSALEQLKKDGDISNNDNGSLRCFLVRNCSIVILFEQDMNTHNQFVERRNWSECLIRLFI